MESIFINMTESLYRSLLITSLFLGGVFFLLFLGPYKKLFLMSAALTLIIFLLLCANGRV